MTPRDPAGPRGAVTAPNGRTGAPGVNPTGADSDWFRITRAHSRAHLDALAADGPRFSHAFCTTASCSPSRSVILSGQHKHRNGMYGLQHDLPHFQSFATVKSLPVRLTEAGYRTARIGKFHLAPESGYAFQTVLSGGAANDPGSLGRSPVEMAEQTRTVIAAADPRPSFLYFAVEDPHRGNIVLPNGRPSFDLYDLAADPHEVVDLADAPAQQALKRELLEKLKAFQTATKDPWVHKWIYE